MKFAAFRFGVTAAIVSAAVSSLLAYGSARLGRQLSLGGLGGGGVASCTQLTVGNPKWHVMWHGAQCQGDVYSSMTLFQLTFKQF